MGYHIFFKVKIENFSEFKNFVSRYGLGKALRPLRGNELEKVKRMGED